MRCSPCSTRVAPSATNPSTLSSATWSAMPAPSAAGPGVLAGRNHLALIGHPDERRAQAAPGQQLVDGSQVEQVVKSAPLSAAGVNSGCRDQTSAAKVSAGTPMHRVRACPAPRPNPGSRSAVPDEGNRPRECFPGRSRPSVGQRSGAAVRATIVLARGGIGAAVGTAVSRSFGATVGATVRTTVVLARGAVRTTVGGPFGATIRTTVVLARRAFGSAVGGSLGLSHVLLLIEGQAAPVSARPP